MVTLYIVSTVVLSLIMLISAVLEWRGTFWPRRRFTAAFQLIVVVFNIALVIDYLRVFGWQ